MLAKIDVWFSSRKVQKAMAKINPRYLARSPVNILSATKFMYPTPSKSRSLRYRGHSTGFFRFHADELSREPNPTHLRGSPPIHVRERPDNSLIVFAAWAFLALLICV